MAIDNTQPRLRLIVTIGVITVVTLVALDFVFKSYLAMMSDDAQRSKLAPTTELDEHRRAETAALTAAKIDRAMADLGKGRAPSIEPQQSDDVGSMTGWTKMPKPAPTPEPIMAPVPQDPAADAGATAEGDAAAAPALAADAGGKPTSGDAGVQAAPSGHDDHGHH